MDILNMNSYPVHPRIVDANGVVDSIHVMPKRRTTLPPGFTVDTNWLASAEKVSVFESRTSNTPKQMAAAGANVAFVANASYGAIQLSAEQPGGPATNEQIQAAQAEAIRRAQAQMVAPAPEPEAEPEAAPAGDAIDPN